MKAKRLPAVPCWVYAAQQGTHETSGWSCRSRPDESIRHDNERTVLASLFLRTW